MSNLMHALIRPCNASIYGDLPGMAVWGCPAEGITVYCTLPSCKFIDTMSVRCSTRQDLQGSPCCPILGCRIHMSLCTVHSCMVQLLHCTASWYWPLLTYRWYHMPNHVIKLLLQLWTTTFRGRGVWCCSPFSSAFLNSGHQTLHLSIR